MSSNLAVIPAARAYAREVTLFQLYLLRAAYLVLVVGLGTSVWPALIHHEPWALTLSPWLGVGASLIAALPILGIFGLRYPLKMLPLLVFEVTWKTIWLIAIALPVWMSHSPIDDDLAAPIQACVIGMLFSLVIPWRYGLETSCSNPEIGGSSA